MECNIGKVDLIVRIIMGLVLILLAAYLQSIILGVMGIIPLATGITRFCPIYTIFKINSGCDKK